MEGGAAAVTGFLVTLLEAVCTGQVYLPTIILMTRAEGLRLTRNPWAGRVFGHCRVRTSGAFCEATGVHETNNKVYS